MKRYILTTLFTFSLILIVFPSFAYGISLFIQQFPVSYRWLILVGVLFIIGILSGVLSVWTFYARLFPIMGYKVYKVEKPSLPFKNVIKDRISDVSIVIFLSILVNAIAYGWLIDVTFSSPQSLKLVGQFFLSFLILDSWFYWIHRLLHFSKKLFRIHRTHHLILVHEQVPFITKPLEDLLASVINVVVTLSIVNILMGPVYIEVVIYSYIFWLWLIIPIGHSNVEFFTSPVRWLLGGPWISTTVTYHSLHHTRFKENYGALSMLWDRLMGTVSPDYEAIYQRVIHEQPLTSIKEHLNFNNESR